MFEWEVSPNNAQRVKKCSITIEVKVNPSPQKKKEFKPHVAEASHQMSSNPSDILANELQEDEYRRRKAKKLEKRINSSKDLLALLQDSSVSNQSKVDENRELLELLSVKSKASNYSGIESLDALSFHSSEGHHNGNCSSREEQNFITNNSPKKKKSKMKVFGDTSIDSSKYLNTSESSFRSEDSEKSSKKKKKNKQLLSVSTPTKKSIAEVKEDLLSCLDFTSESSVLHEESYEKKSIDGNSEVEGNVLDVSYSKKEKNKGKHKKKVVDNSQNITETDKLSNNKYSHLGENQPDGMAGFIISDGLDEIKKKKKCKKSKEVLGDISIDSYENFDPSESSFRSEDGEKFSKKKKKDKQSLPMSTPTKKSNEEVKDLLSSLNLISESPVLQEKSHQKKRNDEVDINYPKKEKNKGKHKMKNNEKPENEHLQTEEMTEFQISDCLDEITKKKKKHKKDKKQIEDNETTEVSNNSLCADKTVNNENEGIVVSHKVRKKKKHKLLEEEHDKTRYENEESVLSDDYPLMNGSENNLETVKKKKKRKHVDDVNTSLSVTEDSDNQSPKKKKHMKMDLDESVLSTDYSILDANISAYDDTCKEKSKKKNKCKMRTNNDQKVESSSEIDSSVVNEKSGQTIDVSATIVGKKKHNLDDNKENDFLNLHTDLSHPQESSATKKHIEDSDDSDLSESKSTKKSKHKIQTQVASKLRKIFSKHKYKPIKTSAKPLVQNRRKALALDSTKQQVQENVETKVAPIEEAPDKSFEELLEDVEEKEILSRRRYKDLARLHILVPWSIPPLHLIETSVAGRPNERQKQQLEESGVQIKSGKFSQEEDKRLRKNWRRFCKMHNIPPDPTPFLNFTDPDGRPTMPKPERVNYARFLAHGLDNRMLNAVYGRFRRMYLKKDLKTGNYTPQEDKVIIDYIKNSSSETPYADLAKLLNRSRISVHTRCMNLAEYLQNSTRIEWNKDFIENFLKELMYVTKVEDVSELKDRKITNEEWKIMSERLDISRNKLYRGWAVTVYPKLFIEKSMKTSSIKKKLVRMLIERGEKDWRALDWQEIAQSFDGFSPWKLNRIMKDMVAYHCPLEIQNNLAASLEYLKDVVKKQLKTPLKARYITKLEIVNNREEAEET